MPNKIRRAQVRKCASDNYTKPNTKVRANWQAMDKSTATRKEKLAVHRVAKDVNKTWRQMLRRCDIIQLNSFWCVFTNAGDLLAHFASVTDAVNFAKANA